MSGAAFGIVHRCEHCDGPLIVESASTLVDDRAPLVTKSDGDLREFFGGVLRDVGLAIRREYGPEAVVGFCPWCMCALVLSEAVEPHAH